jgi:diguanylate cyclase (GGDEF)-like protein/PAS domain S-box-containing protein
MTSRAPVPDDLLRGAFEEAAIGLAVIDLDPSCFGRVAAANPAFAALIGRGLDDLIGADVCELGGLHESAEVRARLSRLASGASSPYPVERMLLPPDGRRLWVRCEASLIVAAPGSARSAVLTVHDVTRDRRAQQRADAQVVVTRILSQSSTVEGGISALVPALAQALGFEIGAAWTLDPSGQRLRTQAIWRFSATTAPAFVGLTREFGFARGVGLPGRVWETGEVQCSDDLASESTCPRRSVAASDGVHSAVALPIRIGAEFVGVVELLSTWNRGIEKELVQLFADMGSEVSERLARKRAQEHISRSSELLLVEDDMFIARLVGEMLLDAEIELDLVHVDRLSAACAQIVGSPPPACVLLDLTLPDADGLQSLLQIRKLAPDAPIVVLTGVEDEDLAVRAVQEGAQDYLIKRKVDFVSLARSIRYAIERKGAEQQRLEDRLSDRLTGLPNRVRLLDRLRVALGRNDAGNVAVLLVNIDRFRVINDSLGHESGDQVLRAVAGLLTDVGGPGATVACLGGDEFAVLLEGVDERTAITVAERVATLLRAPMQIGEEEILVTATVGIGISAERADAERLLAEADTAMSRGKELGGDRSEIFEEGVRQRVRERMRLENGLRNAIDRGELRVYYQPIVQLDTRALVAFEALVRWQHPAQGLVSPAEFMPIAEESGLILPLGDWVLNEACAQVAAWHAAFPEQRDLRVNVNLSARQLSDPRLEDTVRAAVDEHGLAPCSLCLEVTETSMIVDIEASLSTLHALRAHGIALALDDFGTGYSSLAYLQRFPVNVLKLDRSFVRGLRERNEEAIVAGVASMAKALGLRPLAEGVECEADDARLRALGYSHGQGYLYGRPEEPAVAMRHLKTDGVRA